ncbi:MAG: CopD family protein [Candidatus Rokubacteria bacterium]|nr:CopD family protein [Candidatus Rokubacteria bacterium]
MLFVALVLVPVARRLNDPALRARLFHETGLQFRTVGWVALAVLVATGIVNLVLRPYLLTVPRFQVKLGLVVVALLLALVHDFVLGPRAGAPGGNPRARIWASWVARVNVLVVLAIVVLGVALRG